MSFCAICSFRKLHPSHQINSAPQFSSDLTRELGDLRKFSMNALMTLTAVVAVSGSKAVLPVVLAFLVYSISLRLAINACFVQNDPVLSRFLHAVPPLGTFCMAGVGLVLDTQSPTLSALALFPSILPFIIIVVHHGKRCEETPLLVRMRSPPPLNHVGVC